MKLEEVLPALREGKKVRRTSEPWVSLIGFIQLEKDLATDRTIIATENREDSRFSQYIFKGRDFYVDDWEVVK